jgi:hypothetical protein
MASYFGITVCFARTRQCLPLHLLLIHLYRLESERRYRRSQRDRNPNRYSTFHTAWYVQTKFVVCLLVVLHSHRQSLEWLVDRKRITTGWADDVHRLQERIRRAIASYPPSDTHWLADIEALGHDASMIDHRCQSKLPLKY